MAVRFKGIHCPPEIILTGVRWYLASPLSPRHVEALMLARGGHVDHATIDRWVIKYSPLLEAAFHRRKRPVWVSWRLDETYIKVKSQWHSLYRAVDKHGQTIDFLLTENRDEQAATRFLTKAIRRHGVPEKIPIDGSAANEAAIKSYNTEHGTAIVIRKIKYLKNVVEQDQRAVKRVTRPMLGFKAFEAAQATLVGIERMHRIKKRQMVVETGSEGLTTAELFYSLAASSPYRESLLPLHDLLSDICDGTGERPSLGGPAPCWQPAHAQTIR
jgi:putative transposase